MPATAILTRMVTPTCSENDDRAAVAAAQGQWMAVQTHPQKERSFAWQLHERGLPYFLPMLEISRLHGGVRRRVKSLVFPGYCFICGEESADVARDMRGGENSKIISILRPTDPLRLRDELLNLCLAVRADPTMGQYDGWSEGMHCRVLPGHALFGVIGRVLRVGDKWKLRVEVYLLGRGVEVEIDREYLEVI